MNRRQLFRRNSGYFIISALLLAGCSSVADPGEERLNIRGEITLLKTEGLQHQQALAEIIIEEDPSIPMDAWLQNQGSYSSQKVMYSVLPSTRIYRQIGDGPPVQIGLEELTIGATVRAWNTGFVVKTLLPRAYAEKIIEVSAAP